MKIAALLAAIALTGCVSARGAVATGATMLATGGLLVASVEPEEPGHLVPTSTLLLPGLPLLAAGALLFAGGTIGVATEKP